MKKRWFGIGCGLVGMVGACGCLGTASVPLGCRGASAVRELQDPPPPHEHVQGGDVRVHVRRWKGPNTGPVVLFVPGTSAWADTWEPVAGPLAEAGFQVVALDLPPFGWSQRPSDGDYSRGAQAARILGVIDTLGLKDVILVGHSFGGGATVEAAMGAENLRHLVLIDVALGLDQAPAPGAGVLGSRPVAEILTSMTVTNPWFTPAGVDSMVFDPDLVQPVYVERYQAPLAVAGTTSAVARWVPELLSPAPSKAGEPANYAALTVPTTVIWGAEDTATPLAQGEALHALLPNSTLLVLPDVGHIPQIEAPRSIVEALKVLDVP